MCRSNVTGFSDPAPTWGRTTVWLVIATLDEALVATWPATEVAVAVVDATGIVAAVGDVSHRFALASVTKPLFATAILVAVEEHSLALDDPCGPPGSTIRHLLAHASGLAADERVPLAGVGRRRIYSNAGYELLAEALHDSTGISARDYLAEGVFEPLGMTTASLVGSPAHGATASVADLAAWVREFLAPAAILSAETVAAATTVQWGELGGVLPGYGTQEPNPWGLGVEIRGAKSPHWTGRRNSPATFGHFGRSGTFVWVDPVVGIGLVGLGDLDFGDWALDLWPAISDDVLGSVLDR